jgi:hypothetical protein
MGRALATLALPALVALPACRIFVDDNAPCRDGSDCPPDSACVEQVCRASSGDDDAGTPENGFVDGVCKTPSIFVGDDRCPGDVFRSDFISFTAGDGCFPDLIVGGTTFEDKPTVALFASSGGAFRSFSDVQAPTLTGEQAGGVFGAAVAIQPQRIGLNFARAFLIGDTRFGTASTRPRTPVDGRAMLVTINEPNSSFKPFEFTFGGGDTVAFSDTADTRFLVGAPRLDAMTGQRGGVVGVGLEGTSTHTVGVPATTLFNDGVGRLGEYVRDVGDLDGIAGSEVGVSAVGLTDANHSDGEYGLIAFTVAALFEDQLLPAKRIAAPLSGERFGRAFSRAGDLDCDGNNDIFVGAPGALADRGGLYAVSDVTASTRTDAPSSLGRALLGTAIEPLGDLTGDNISEVAVGAPFASTSGPADPTCALAAGAPSAYVGDCAGAVVVFDGADVMRGEAEPMCIIATDVGARARAGASLRALDRPTATRARIAIGAPGTSTRSGGVVIATIIVTDGRCEASTVSLQHEGTPGDAFGAILAF